MTTLFLDIDNTLIYSHRHAMTAPKRVAEILDGKEQSYISQQTYSFFTAQQDLQIVPVTTRTMPQFRRLWSLLEDLNCHYSLICNGAILLHNLEIDHNWYEETLALAGSELPEIEKAEKWLAAECGEISTHTANGLFVYAKSSEPERIASSLRQYVDTGKVDVMYDHIKTYCIPKSLNKGTAVQRFSRRFNVQSSIAVGDSDFDIPMLNQADMAIIPETLDDKVTNKKRFVVKKMEIFSDEICSALGQILSS